MINVLVSAMLVYLSTSVDYFVLFVLLFGRIQTKEEGRGIYMGHYLGMVILVGLSLLAAYFLHFIPQPELVGLLGFIPIYYGLQIARGKMEDPKEQAEAVIQDAYPLWFDVMVLTVTLSGDNFGIFPPYFLLLERQELFLALGVFALGIYLLCKTAELTSTIPKIQEMIQTYEKIIVPLVLMGLGLYVLWSNGTFEYMFRLLNSYR